jgi:DNA polymerase III subunit epsilon
MNAQDYPNGAQSGYAAFDLETANKDLSSICAIGLVVIDGGEVVKRVSYLVRPPKLDFEYTGINGIGQNDVKDKPAFHELWPELKQYFQNRFVIAHNADFDVSALRHVLNLYGISHPTLCYLCTRKLAKRLWPGLDSYGLARVSIHLGVDFAHHDPAEDAFACAHIAVRGCQQLAVETLEDLANQTGILLGRMGPGRFEKCRLIPQPRTVGGEQAQRRNRGKSRCSLE